MCCYRWRRVRGAQAIKARFAGRRLFRVPTLAPRPTPVREPLLRRARVRAHACVCARARSAFVLGHTLGALRVPECDSDPLTLLRSGLPLSPGGPAPVGSGERAAIVQTGQRVRRTGAGRANLATSVGPVDGPVDAGRRAPARDEPAWDGACADAGDRRDSEPDWEGRGMSDPSLSGCCSNLSQRISPPSHACAAAVVCISSMAESAGFSETQQDV